MKKLKLIYPCSFEVFDKDRHREQEKGIDDVMKEGYMPFFVFADNPNNVKNLIPTKFKKNIEKHPAYLLWITALMRCYNKGHEEYSQYGGAGVVIKNSWVNSFEQFCKDMKITNDMA